MYYHQYPDRIWQCVRRAWAVRVHCRREQSRNGSSLAWRQLAAADGLFMRREAKIICTAAT
jgi:hypothetical protein